MRSSWHNNALHLCDVRVTDADKWWEEEKFVSRGR